MRGVREWAAALCCTALLGLLVFGVLDRVDTAGADTEAVPVSADGFTVVLDAGHGGADGGAVGSDTGVLEAELNLSVAKSVQTALEAAGVHVIMTRTDEHALAATKAGDMQKRGGILRAAGADMAVSIHMNAFSDRTVSGPMVYYMTGSAQGLLYAEIMIDSLTDALGRERRIANPGDYFVLRECACPALLVECGFLSNSGDEALLSTEAHRALLAEAISAGVLACLSLLPQ